MVAQGSDPAGVGFDGEHSRTDELALVLDGKAPTSNQRATNAHRFSLRHDQEAFQPMLGRLRRWSPHAVAIVSSKLALTPRLLQVLEVPHVVVSSILDVPRQSSIVVLGCQDPASFPSHALSRALSRGITVVTSDKSASLEPLREVLSPGPSRPSHVARVQFVIQADGGMDGHGTLRSLFDGSIYPPVQLPPGYVPICPDPQVEILARDGLSGDPLFVRASIGAGTLIHAVPHWWQYGVARTAMDRRRLADIPTFAEYCNSVGDITLGEFQAARAMIVALLGALRPILE